MLPANSLRPAAADAGPAPRAAVLFLVFNRPDVTARVFDAIRAARPPRLYLAADGPRAQRPAEADACAAVRRLVLDGIDWPCTVHTRLLADNRGCRRAVSEAISWFFEHEEAGIILEDDCLPEPTFFPYCETLLHHYRHDTRVMHLSGSTTLPGPARDPDYSYYFSGHAAIWGWASWRRAWQYYDVNSALLPELGRKRYFWRRFLNAWEERQLLPPLWAAHRGQLDTWDYQWSFAVLAQSGLSVTPAVNLVSNIGFGQAATHTANASHPWANLPTHALPLPLHHPPFMLRDTLSDHRRLRGLLRDKVVARLRHVAALVM